MHDLIFVSLEDWDDIWRRNQFLCAGLARRFPDKKILFVGLARDVSNRIRRGKVGDLLRPAIWSPDGLPNITVFHPLKFLPNSLPPARRVNENYFRSQVQSLSARLGLKSPLLWLNPHSAVHMAGQMGERAVVYDITDDWTQADRSAAETRLTIEQDAALCLRADLTIVCSQSLAESRGGRVRRLLLLPNGVDAAHYARERISDAPQWPHPVFGYTGTLHPDRIDVSLIVAAARAFPDGKIILIGPNLLRAEEKAELTKEPNVLSVGPVPYAQIPKYMAAFDVCIVPHHENLFTNSLNPIKLWEYLACGKPIVSANVAGFRDYAHLCRIASGPDAFAAACREALDEGDRLTAARRDVAARESWEARLDALLAELTALEPSRVLAEVAG